MDDSLANPLIRRLTLAFFLGGLFLLAWIVLRPFLVPVLWAGILAFVTWPLFLRVHRAVRSLTLASLLMTLLVGAVIIAPLAWLVLSLRVEVASGYQDVLAKVTTGQVRLPQFVLNLPLVGGEIRAFLERIAADPQLIGREIAGLVERSFGKMSAVVGGVGRNVAKLALALLTLFFLYRAGEQVLQQLKTVLRGILGVRVDNYVDAVGATTRAVVYGIVLTALVQGAFAAVVELDDAEGPVRDRLVRLFRDFQQVVEQLVASAVRHRHLRPDADPTQFAHELLAIRYAHHWCAALMRDPGSMARTRSAFAGLVTRGRSAAA